MNPTIEAALIGIGGGLGGSLGTIVMLRRDEHARWVMDRRTDLYLDMISYFVEVAERVGAGEDPYPPRHEMQILNARVMALGSAWANNHWRHFNKLVEGHLGLSMPPDERLGALAGVQMEMERLITKEMGVPGTRFKRRRFGRDF